MTNLVKLINAVYTEAESGMWKESFQRTTVDEMKTLIGENKVMLAKYQEKIVGSVVVTKQEKDSTGMFGMLVIDPNLRGKKFGSALVQATEDWAKS